MSDNLDFAIKLGIGAAIIAGGYFFYKSVNLVSDTLNNEIDGVTTSIDCATNPHQEKCGEQKVDLTIAQMKSVVDSACQSDHNGMTCQSLKNQCYSSLANQGWDGLHKTDGGAVCDYLCNTYGPCSNYNSGMPVITCTPAGKNKTTCKCVANCQNYNRYTATRNMT